ncbi:serine hydrolase domain-containing protein [Leisingera thetidis]|uniref:serine hydrolase domain-containing protein n=1 Tax=Leisingera thetidis TaxID=2930199 RepID=UPI0021F76BDD|nr:serine hydrolase [Leisingera thetidis]
MTLLRPLALTAAMTATAAAGGEIEDSLQTSVDAGDLPGLHGVLVQRQNEILAEIYFAGEDERWGSPLGSRRFGPGELHDLRSVSKSIVSLLYGIALAQGLVPPPSAPLLAQFPEHADLATPEREAITVEDALTMQLGLQWDESLPYSDPRNSEIAMERSGDRIRYVLSRPLVTAPGEHWVYSGGATTLLAELITRGSGMALDDFARENLFAPLGIERMDWANGLDGRPAAASGLRLTARGLARIGEMIANGGRSGGKQIVPAGWLEQSLTPHADTGDLRYGYQWWLAPEGNPPVWAAGFGNGGQRLTISQMTGTVVVIQAGNYNQPDAWQMPVAVLTKHILPNLPRK